VVKPSIHRSFGFRQDSLSHLAPFRVSAFMVGGDTTASSGKLGRPPRQAGQLPDFSVYEAITEQEFHQGQVGPIRSWIHGMVLDLGANFGRFSAFSPSTISLDIGKRWLIRGIDLGNIRQAIVGSALALPFKKERFDTVLALGITEHIPPESMADFLDEVTRVTKAGGRLVIKTSSPYAIFAILRRRMWNAYLHPYSPLRLRRQLLQRGWHQVGWMSSGLLGVTRILPHTVNSPVLWARSSSQVFILS